MINIRTKLFIADKSGGILGKWIKKINSGRKTTG